MKAFLLAAGLGTRLRPLTNTVPKCLVPINGKPLLEYWMELFRHHGIDEVLINTHYLVDAVRAFINEHNSNGELPHIVEAYEPELLGSAGTVANNRAFIGDDDSFLVCYADNLTNVDLSSLVSFHKDHHADFTMALFRTSVPKQCGIAAVDADCRIVEFVEKPESPKSDLANAGIYVMNSILLDSIPKGFYDFGKDMIPNLVGKMFGYEIDDYLMDIGTLEKYNKAQTDILTLCF